MRFVLCVGMLGGAVVSVPAEAGKLQELGAKLKEATSPFKEEEREALRARVAAFEQLHPVAAELTADGRTPQSFLDMLKEASELSVSLQASTTMQNGFGETTTYELFPEAEEDALRKRVWDAKLRYMLEAAEIAKGAGAYNQAFWVLNPEVDDAYKYENADRQVIVKYREIGPLRAKLRGAELTKYKTYAADGVGGNCVFSTQPFGKEGTANPALGYYFAGRTQIHMRCYAENDLRNFSGPEGQFRVVLSINDYVWWAQPAGKPADYAAGQKYVDVSFVVPKDPIDQDDFALLDAKLQFGQVTGYVWEGNQQVAQWYFDRLGGSTLFWEYNPGALP